MNLNQIEKALNEEIKEGEVYDDVILLSDSAVEKELENNYARFPIGIYPFDEVSKLREEDQGGLGGGDLAVVAGPTGNGKSLFSATISYNLLKNQGMPTLWFTYEISSYALWRIFENMGAQKGDLVCVPANHTTGKLEWVESKIKEGKEKYDIGSVVIDHLGFLAPVQKMNGNMSQNYSVYLAQIVRELKTIAVKYNISIILPVHMVKSANDDPSLRDIGHSGGIAQEADFVFLIAREESSRSKNFSGDYYTQYTKVSLAKNRVSGKTPSWFMELFAGRLIECTKTDIPINEKIYGKY